jgi:hypothetical protein
MYITLTIIYINRLMLLHYVDVDKYRTQIFFFSSFQNFKKRPLVEFTKYIILNQIRFFFINSGKRAMGAPVAT